MADTNTTPTPAGLTAARLAEIRARNDAGCPGDLRDRINRTVDWLHGTAEAATSDPTGDDAWQLRKASRIIYELSSEVAQSESDITDLLAALDAATAALRDMSEGADDLEAIVDMLVEHGNDLETQGASLNDQRDVARARVWLREYVAALRALSAAARPTDAEARA